MKKYCIDCHKFLGYTFISKRCIKCYLKYVRSSPKHNSGYIDGRSAYGKCEGCNKSIHYNTKRFCRKCYHIWLRKHPAGFNLIRFKEKQILGNINQCFITIKKRYG